MIRQKLLLSGALLALLAGGVIGARRQATSQAQPEGYTLDWFSYSTALNSSGGDYRQSGAVGQPAAGVLANGEYMVNGGFTARFGALSNRSTLYLPLLRR